MSTTDVRNPGQPSFDRLEADLSQLFSFQPPAGVVGRLDEDVERMLGAWSPRADRDLHHLQFGRRAGVVALVATALLIAGATTGGFQELYRLIVGPFDVPWQRGVEVNLSQVVDGYRVTIDRAYADATRLALAISVVDELEREGTTQLAAMATIVTDEDGEYDGAGAASIPDGPFAAANVVWKTPAVLPLPAGPRLFHVVVPWIEVRADATPPPNADSIDWTAWQRHPGPWTFDFELVVDGGTALTPNAAAEVDGVRVEVTRLIAASNIVRVEMRVDGNLPGQILTPVGEVRHGGRTLPFVAIDFGSEGTMAILTDGGVGDASGTWTVVVSELAGDGYRLAGPWILEFDAP